MKSSADQLIESLSLRVRKILLYLQNKSNVIANGLGALLWGALGVEAITQLDTLSWDSLAYHLPFASRLAGIFPQSGYIFYARLEPLYAGGPKLAEFLQGILWRLTGLVSAPNLVGWACILLLTIITSKKMKVPFWLVTLFFLSIPLVLIHSETSMTDLPTNSFIGIAFVMLLAAFNERRFDNKSLFLVLLPLSIAANMKFQALEITIPFWTVTLFLFLFQNKDKIRQHADTHRGRYLGGFLLVNAIIALIFGWSYMLNAIQFNNPFYPLAVHAGPIRWSGPFGAAVSIDGPLSIQRGTAGPRQTFEAYLLSLSELQLWTHNRGQLWSVDMGVVWNSQVGAITYKSGGFFVANLILWSVFLLFSIVSTKNRISALWFLFVLANFIFVGILPGAIILRYWLFLPLELAIVTMWVSKQNPEYLKSVFLLVVILQFALFSFVAFENRTVFPSRYIISHVQRGVENLPKVQASYRLSVPSSSYVCIVAQDTRLGFLYKLSNPEIRIQAAQAEQECQSGTTILHP